MNRKFIFSKGLTGSDIVDNHQALGIPVEMVSSAGFRRGQEVRCHVRRCESGGREGEIIHEPRIEHMDGVLEWASMSGAMWWVRTESGLRFVWNDELEAK